MTNSSLRNTIRSMATDFATGILEAIRGASLDDILTETSGRASSRGTSAPRTVEGRRRKTGRGGRLARRSAADISAMVGRIVALLARNPKGLRAEQIREELSLDAKELPRPIADALRSRKISKSGQKRATTYFAKGGSGRPARKGATRRASAGRSSGRKASKAGKGKRRAAKRGNNIHAMNGVAAS